MQNANGDLLADARNVFSRRKNHICELSHAHGVHGVSQTKLQTSEPLILELSCFEVEIAFLKLKRYKSSGIGRILAELIQECGNTLNSETHEPINSICNIEESPSLLSSGY
jgi:hypothetical protein